MNPPVLPQLAEIEAILDAGGAHLRTNVVCEVAVGEQKLPVYSIALGNPDAAVPVIGFFGGVHGLERIGAEVVIAYLRNLVTRLPWDRTLHHQLETCRVVFMPLVNPGGVLLGTRANPNGIDLMRNAPIDAIERVPFLIGGQRTSARLPWYRGAAGAPMERENLALCHVVESELFRAPFSLAIDCHSGFGTRDRLWFPLAHSSVPIPHLPEVHALKEIFLAAHHHHRYIFEPQSHQYLAHGDVWDYLYQRAHVAPSRVFLPLTLEMGSWIWVKKNPRQLLSRHGIFNPLIAHRRERVLRRHLPLLDFFARAAASHTMWLPSGKARATHEMEALRQWYPHLGIPIA